MAKRTDANQAEIVEALRRVGCSVVDLHAVGRDCPDILVGVPWSQWGRAVNILVEIKTARGKLSPGQQAFHESWRGPVVVVRSVEEALEVVGLAATSIARTERNVAQTVR